MASVQEILNKDYRKISNKNISIFRSDIQDLLDVANKRIKRIKATYTGVYEEIPAISNLSNRQKQLLTEGKNAFTIKGVKDIDQLKNTMADVKRFLSASTSSVRGVKTFERKMQQIMGGVIKPGTQEYKTFWAVIDELRKADNKYTRATPGSDVDITLASTFAEQFMNENGIDKDKLYLALKASGDDLYVKSQEQRGTTTLELSN